MIVDLIFNNILPLLGGVALFLYGMKVMGAGLEKIAGGPRNDFMSKVTSSKFKAFILGLGITAVVQSSTATAVMALGFVNSGILNLSQAVSVIIGSNIGSTVTAWILSLTGISSGGSIFLKIINISSLTPLIALAGVFVFMFAKNGKKKDISTIIIGFGVLMLGMTYMTNAVKPLGHEAWFTELMTAFSNPFVGVLVGIILTAIIQSSSASVGILQALSVTGSLSLGTAIPIILGQNIGKVIPVLLATIGANKRSKRAGLAHLYFNIIGTLICLVGYFGISLFVDTSSFLSSPANQINIAIIHSGFNIITAVLLLPLQSFLEKLTNIGINEKPDEKDTFETLDDHFLSTPAVAIDRATKVAFDMAHLSVESIYDALDIMYDYDPKIEDSIREKEDKVDKFEDKLGTYLVQLNSRTYKMSNDVSRQSAKILHLISDFERISDHSVNLCESSREMYDKKFVFSDSARNQLAVLFDAIREITSITLRAFEENDVELAASVEPLEQVVDVLKEQIKHRHIERLRSSDCTIESGFILTDIVSNLERVSDHCSNIAGCIIEMNRNELEMHKYLGNIKTYDESFKKKYNDYLIKYSLEGI